MESKAPKKLFERLIDWVLAFCGWDLGPCRGS
jgi:hypothetical protein